MDSDKSDKPEKAKKTSVKRDGKAVNKANSPKKGHGKKNEYQRPRGMGVRQISDLMPDIGRAAFRRFGFVQSSIVSRWDEIVGEKYAAVSAPEMIRFPRGQKSGGTLELTVIGAHAPMMQHVIPVIMERVNRFFGYNAVSKVKIAQGYVAPPNPNERKAKAAPILKPLTPELGDGLRSIGDPELSAVLQSLAQSLENASGNQDKPKK
ncbi:hypothetical protein LPB140_05070 [Sphingorhabdus lutea]|uniref:DUF721 domain-containing protein n=1 Tax=Sphingorhabdus lutea TaxID=1913578 RepID=A0A1L3JAX7_9SPHN|nr:DciA family protein [Sphingorhabdus lutea]APG62278.1 hypothetical protein LPB140_05070 [Sphingorhabdus lutea]